MGRLVFNTSTEVLRVPADAVVFVTADGNYSALTTADGEDFVLTIQLGQIEKRLARCSMAMTIALYALARA